MLLAAPLAVVALAPLAARALPASAQRARGDGRAAQARAARTLRASDTAHLRYVSASGAVVYETGRATGTLPGSMRVHMRIAASFSGSFTIYAAGGAIEGHGNATPHGEGIYESFAGSLKVNGGSGRYAHAHGSAHLYGTFDRRTYALVVQTVGTLLY